MTDLSPIEAHERVIGRIFSDDYAFEIPPYQRPYAWETDQARDLLNDLLEAMEDTTASGGVYFLGSIVLIKSPGAPASKVVDGQQRLTTLTILLSVLRDLTTDPGRKLGRTAYVHQAANPDTGAADRHRLLLRERDREFFHRHVQKAGATDNLPDKDKLAGSQLRLVENAALFRTRLAEMDEARRDRLVAFIIQRCYLVGGSRSDGRCRTAHFYRAERSWAGPNSHRHPEGGATRPRGVRPKRTRWPSAGRRWSWHLAAIPSSSCSATFA